MIKDELFESSVISYGSESVSGSHFTENGFESSVISYGSESLL